MKVKKCKSCKKEFKQTYSTTQIVCNLLCSIEYEKNKLIKKNRKIKKEYYANDIPTLKIKCQKLANKIGRLRQYKKGRFFCVTCGIKTGKFDGGHCFPTSMYPLIRYDIRQIQPQCVKCNRYNGGEPALYERELTYQLGERLVSWFKSQKGVILKRDIKYYQRYLKIMTKFSKRYK